MAQRPQPLVRIRQVVKHPGADHVIKRASELGHVLNRQVVKLEILEVILSLKLARVTEARLADIDGGDSSIRLAKGVPRRLRRTTTRNEDLLISP